MVLNVHRNLIRDGEKEGKEGMEHGSKKASMVLYVHRNLIRDGDKGGGGGGVGGYGGGERGRLYAYHYTVTTRMTPALIWAAMRAILRCH